MMTTMTTTRDAVRPAWGNRVGRSALLVIFGALLGAAAMLVRDDPAPVFPGALFAQEDHQVGGNTGGDYLFFTFRRNLWTVHRPSGTVQFLMFPDGKEQVIIRSRVYQVDPAAFPPDQTRYLLSERNLTTFLWVLNPVTAKAQFVRAGRDGALEFSEVESVDHKG
jgi:hypothetical protein